MGYLEASVSPLRHSTHHHRHTQPRGEMDSRKIPNNRPRLKHLRKTHKNNPTRREPNNISQSQTRYDVVENWLEQIAEQNPHSWPSVPREHQKDAIGYSFLSEPLDTTSPYNKHASRADPEWSPRHGFPRDEPTQSRSPPQALALENSRRSTRRRRIPSDSSFISGFENSTKPPGYNPSSIHEEREDTPPARRLGEAGLAPLDASSATTQQDAQLNFGKRPRRKTREDRYETKKKKRKHGEGNAMDHSDRRSRKRRKSEKRKSTVLGKHIMSNFTSDAVLNDRITVQPHLKPGLFDNGRKSKRRPLSDLTFSEMQFLRHQNRNTQSKALSKSRLREKRRKDREMEEVSLFFRPPIADKHANRPRPHDLRHRVGQLTSVGYREPIRSLSSNHYEYLKDNNAPRTYDEAIDTPRRDPSRSTTDEKEFTKETTYFTWSSSRHSPRANVRDRTLSPNISGPMLTVTPNSVRRSLVATGIYRKTGISPYDDTIVETKATNQRQMDPEVDHNKENQETGGLKKVKYRDQAIMTDKSLKDSEQSGDYRAGGHRAPGSQELDPQIARALQAVDRQQIARKVRLAPVERGSSRQSTRTLSEPYAKALVDYVSPNEVDLETSEKGEAQPRQTSDQASITSRDAMPPPPIPQSRGRSVAAAQVNVEVDPTGQNAPSAMMANEVPPQVPQMVGHGRDMWDTQGPTEECSRTASLSESTITNAYPLSSFDDVSWMPQRTPSTRTAENRIPLSRPNIKSPICVDQCEGKSGRGPYQRDLTRSQAPESMAEFIARIESESQLQYPFQSYDNLDLGLGRREAAPEAPSLDAEQLYEQPPACNVEEKATPDLAPNFRFPHSEPTRLRADEPHEGKLYVVPRTLPGALQPLGDFEGDYFEMSNFWRPNQFSRF